MKKKQVRQYQVTDLTVEDTKSVITPREASILSSKFLRRHKAPIDHIGNSKVLSWLNTMIARSAARGYKHYAVPENALNKELLKILRETGYRISHTEKHPITNKEIPLGYIIYWGKYTKEEKKNAKGSYE